MLSVYSRNEWFSYSYVHVYFNYNFHCVSFCLAGEAMMARARSFGSRAQFAQAQGLKMPSCDNLSKIGITRYSLY